MHLAIFKIQKHLVTLSGIRRDLLQKLGLLSELAHLQNFHVGVEVEHQDTQKTVGQLLPGVGLCLLCGGVCQLHTILLHDAVLCLWLCITRYI